MSVPSSSNPIDWLACAFWSLDLYVIENSAAVVRIGVTVMFALKTEYIANNDMGMSIILQRQKSCRITYIRLFPIS